MILSYYPILSDGIFARRRHTIVVQNVIYTLCIDIQLLRRTRVDLPVTSVFLHQLEVGTRRVES